MEWYRRDKEAVAAALRRGERADLAMTMASGPLDELVALHLATLPFAEQASLSGAAEVLFRKPAVLLQLGWTHHRYVRTVHGHKHIREVEVTAADELSSWESFTEAAASAGVSDAML